MEHSIAVGVGVLVLGPAIILVWAMVLAKLPQIPPEKSVMPETATATVSRPLITAIELAAHLSVCRRTIATYTQKKIIPCIRLQGNFVRYDLDEVMEALKKRGK